MIDDSYLQSYRVAKCMDLLTPYDEQKRLRRITSDKVDDLVNISCDEKFRLPLCDKDGRYWETIHWCIRKIRSTKSIYTLANTFAYEAMRYGDNCPAQLALRDTIMIMYGVLPKLHEIEQRMKGGGDYD